MQVLFLIFGAATILFAAVVLVMLPDVPTKPGSCPSRSETWPWRA